MRARVVVLANGILTTKLARIKGMESFAGESFHTSRWNYDVDLAGKRVGIIGTGATAVQVIPKSPRWSANFTCFSARPRRLMCAINGPPRRRRSPPGRRSPAGPRAPRTTGQNTSGRAALKGNDDYLAGRVADFKERKSHGRKLSPEELIEKQLDTNFRIMEQIRARVDAVVRIRPPPPRSSPITPMAVSGRPSMTSFYRPSTCRM